MKNHRLASRRVGLMLLSCLWLAGQVLPVRPAALVNRERMLIVDGQPRLVLGLYENPADDAVLEEAVEAGFNLIQCSASVEALERVRRAGAKAWVNLGGALDLSVDSSSRREQLAEIVRRVGDHSALLVWEGPDEILWNNWWVTMETLRAELAAMSALAAGKPQLEPAHQHVRDLFQRGLYSEFEEARQEFWRQGGERPPHPEVRIDDAAARVRRAGEGITGGIRAVRELDPSRVIWLNHAPRNSLEDLRFYNREADMVGCDIYPAPANLMVGHSDLADKTLASVGAYTDRMRAAGRGKACAMVLQGFGWRDLREGTDAREDVVGIGRRPTFRESRFMAYDALFHGANAILYWGTAYMKPVEDDGTPAKGRPRLWRDLLRLARELRALEPAWVAVPLKTPEVRLEPTYGSIDGNGILATLRRVDEDYVLMVINETGEGLGFRVEGLPRRLEGRTLHRLYSQEQLVVRDGRMRDGIPGWEVFVYATSRRFEDSRAR